MKILLLEDDLILNEILEEHLLLEKHEVSLAFNGEQAQELLYSKTFELLLLDVNVPLMSGFELLKELRSKEIHTPAIFITSLNMVDDVEKGFEAGCDDYIKKPFELKELDLRINNIKRLFKIEQDKIIKISDSISIDEKNLAVIINDMRLKISLKELEILKYLIKNSEKYISVEEFCSNIWSYEESPSSSTIRTYIKNLRKILGENIISNIRGVGYRFNA